MALSHEILSQFAKLITNNTSRTNTEATVYGTVVVDRDGNKYVQIDGSDQLTPVSGSATASANKGERVSVLIKNHTATVTGNVSSPAARTGDVEDLGNQVQESYILIADQITAQDAYIKNLEADKASIGELEAAEARITELVAKKATIEELEAEKARIDTLEANQISVDILDAKYATVEDLQAVNVDVSNLNASKANIADLQAHDARIDNLEANQIDVKELDAKYANIDFSNIGEAAIEKIFSESGIIRDLIVSEGKITGELVGVTIKGDLIEAGTLKADKLVVKGEDGVYYKLNIEAGAVESAEVSKEELQNGLHGTAIIAKTITAEKIAVDDLVAFDATIGGFHISDSAIYSGVKESAENTTEGVYLDKEGQLSVGDSNNFLRYVKDEGESESEVEGESEVGNDKYKLEISASSISLGTKGMNVEDAIGECQSIEIGSRNLIRNSTTLVFPDYHFKSATNTET